MVYYYYYYIIYIYIYISPILEQTHRDSDIPSNQSQTNHPNPSQVCVCFLSHPFTTFHHIFHQLLSPLATCGKGCGPKATASAAADCRYLSADMMKLVASRCFKTWRGDWYPKMEHHRIQIDPKMSEAYGTKSDVTLVGVPKATEEKTF